MVIYSVRVRNPIVDQEIMQIETDDKTLAVIEAEYYSKRHGIAEVYDNSSNKLVTRFRYGVEEASEE